MPKVFENAWIADDLADHPSYRTRRMFGGLAIYLFEKLMMIIVEPTKSGTWDWHGLLVCTDKNHHQSLMDQLPALTPHEGVKKWLYLESNHIDFEETANQITALIESNDERIGIFPKAKKKTVNKKRKKPNT